MTPQTTGASSHTEVGAMDELHARLRMQGTPRTKRSDRRRARELPSTPSLDKFDMAAFAIDDIVDDDATGLNLADMAAKMLNQLEDASPTPTPRRLKAPEAIQEETEPKIDVTITEPSETNAPVDSPLETPSTPDNRPDPASLITPPNRGTSDYPMGLGIQAPDTETTFPSTLDTARNEPPPAA